MGNLRLMVAVALLAAGCAAAPTYDSKLAGSLEAAKKQDVSEALRALDASNKGSDKPDLLVSLERGELLRIDARYQESQAAFELADAKVKEWEDAAKSDPEKLIGQASATILGDMFRAYEGQDYEKVMLTTRMAMNRISFGDLDNARVDIKRTHEREAVIEEFRAKETAAVEEEAKKGGVTSTSKELNGYPVETLNDPEVLKLKNGYQNALSHYMAGFVYEALNEPSLSAPGYRKAIELRPGFPILEEGLAGLDQRTSFRRPRGLTDVLFVIEVGSAPARKSIRLAFPIPSKRGMIMVPVSLPTIHPNKSAPTVDEIRLGDKSIQTALITDFNVMARRALKDDLPGIQLRAAIRAIGKGVIQEQLNRQSPLLGLVGNIAAVATEAPADDRMWRFLPERIFIARAFVAPGPYELRLPGLKEGSIPVNIDGRHMIVPVRILETRSYFAQPKHFGTAGVAVAKDEPAPAPARATPASRKTSGKSKAPAKAKPTTASTPAGAAGRSGKPAPDAGSKAPVASTKPAAAASVPVAAKANEKPSGGKAAQNKPAGEPAPIPASAPR